MDKRTMARQCRKIWKEVLYSEDGLKPDWAFEQFEYGCPACKFADMDCGTCPLLGLWGKTKEMAAPCERSITSPYRGYCKTIIDSPSVMDGYKHSKKSIAIRKGCAKQIIDYIEKNFKL